jgi:hypothetical protein
VRLRARLGLAGDSTEKGAKMERNRTLKYKKSLFFRLPWFRFTVYTERVGGSNPSPPTSRRSFRKLGSASRTVKADLFISGDRA